jgi:hypothetical protein
MNSADFKVLDAAMISQVRWRVALSWALVAAGLLISWKLRDLLQPFIRRSFANSLANLAIYVSIWLTIVIRSKPVPIPILGPRTKSTWGPPFFWAVFIWLPILIVTPFYLSLEVSWHLVLAFLGFCVLWALAWDLCVFVSPAKLIDFTKPPPEVPLPSSPPRESAPKCGQCGIDLRPGRTGCHWCGWKPEVSGDATASRPQV